MSRYVPRVIGTVGVEPEVRVVIGWQQGEIVEVRPVRRNLPTVEAAMIYGDLMVRRMVQAYFADATVPESGWADYYLEESGWIS